MAIKYNDLYMDLRRRLREAGAEDATQAARELVCTASGKTKNELLRDDFLFVVKIRIAFIKIQALFAVPGQ